MQAILSLTLKSTTFMFSTIKRILLIVTVLSAIFVILPYLVHFQKIPVDLTMQNEYKLFSEELSQYENSTSIQDNLAKRSFLLSSCSINGYGCSKEDPSSSAVSNNSLISFFSNAISTPFEHPPASGVVWMARGLEHIGFIPTSYASKGIGFSAIEGYQNIWNLFRQISYILLVLVMISMGFLIMFRVKLNAQTVIGIESALPRIVVSMILITFSFAIAGFLIDLMYVIMAVGIYVVFETGLSATSTTTSAEMIGRYQNAGFGELWLDEAGNLFSLGTSLWNLIPTALRQATSGLLFLVGMVYTKTAASLPAKIFEAFSGIQVQGTLLGFGGGGSAGNTPQMGTVIVWAIILAIVISILPGTILMIFLAFTVISFMFRIFFTLLTSYIKIILYVVFSPILLMFGAIPGVNIIGWWFKNLAAELAMFPAVTFLLLIGRSILTANSSGGETLSFFGTAIRTVALPGPNPFQLPFISGFSSVDFNTVIGVGIILLTPDFLKMVKGLFGATETPIKFGLGTFFGGAAALGGGLGIYNQIEGWKHMLVGYNPTERKEGVLGGITKMFNPKKGP